MCVASQRRDVDVQDGKAEIVATKLGFTGEKCVWLKSAVRARNECQSSDRNKEDRLLDGILTSFFYSMPHSIAFVLPEAETASSSA
jgi:hypothetical protein